MGVGSYSGLEAVPSYPKRFRLTLIGRVEASEGAFEGRRRRRVGGLTGSGVESASSASASSPDVSASTERFPKNKINI